MHSIHRIWLLLALLLALAPTADSWGQTDFPIPWECGNDPLRGWEEELVAARRKMEQRQADELAQLTKDPKNIDWPRVVELRKQHIRQWHKWFAEQKKEHPKWPFLSDEAERQEERIRYQTNTVYLYYQEHSDLRLDAGRVPLRGQAAPRRDVRLGQGEGERNMQIGSPRGNRQSNRHEVSGSRTSAPRHDARADRGRAGRRAR
jgi:hypothetical protein